MSAADFTDLSKLQKLLIDTGFREFLWISWISIFRHTLLSIKSALYAVQISAQYTGFRFVCIFVLLWSAVFRHRLTANLL